MAQEVGAARRWRLRRCIAALLPMILCAGGLWGARLQMAWAAQDASAGPDAQAQAILGNWLTSARDGIVQITQAANGLYQGRIVGGDHPKRLDKKNPNPAVRDQLLIGQIIMRDMKYDGRGHWSAGSIYDPDTGRIYRCRLDLLEPDRLKVRGFLGLALIGRSQIWTRYLGSSLVLPAR